jgi:DNA-binding MarR family transcriptional regulator
MKRKTGTELEKTLDQWRERAFGGDVGRLRDEWERQLPDVDFFPVVVATRILRMWTIMDAQAEQFAREFGFGAGDADVLVSLRRYGPPFRLRPRELQRLCVVTSGAITGRIDRLAELGLVERSNSAVDRRGFEVRLTRRGVRVAEQVMRRIFEQGVMSRALKTFSDRERQTFDALLERLHTEMELEALNARSGQRTRERANGKMDHNGIRPR